MTIFLLLLLLLLSPACTTPNFADGSGGGSNKKARIVGVTYKPDTPGLPPPAQVVKALLKAGIPRVRILGPSADTIAAFKGSGIDLNLSIENSGVLETLSLNESHARRILKDWVVPSLPDVKISSISIGFGVLGYHDKLAPHLLPAIKNMHYACLSVGMDNVSVTAGNTFDIIENPVPPSTAEFKKSTVPYLKEVLSHAAATGAAYQTSLFPFYVYTLQTMSGVSVRFIKFEAREDQFVVDPVTKLRYRNMYEMMVDAVIVALAKVGYNSMQVMVLGLGWPSSSPDKDVMAQATFLNAAEYNERVVGVLNQRPGTPLRRTVTPVTFIHGLFDEPHDENDATSSNFGIWKNDLSAKYTINFRQNNGDGAAAAASTRLGGLSRLLSCIGSSLMATLLLSFLR